MKDDKLYYYLLHIIIYCKYLPVEENMLINYWIHNI